MSNRPEPARSNRTAAAGVAEPETAETVNEDDTRDHLRHIICMLCYPAFGRSREAPHDAICICGKQLRKGEMPNPSSAAQCILCNELWKHHLATVHPDE
jgi:hypothetical protein